MMRHMITSGDGTRLLVREAGNPSGSPILFLHGWSQHHQCWKKQLSSDLAENYRLLAMDLRGHGGSDKPQGEEHYNHSEPWAGDIAAVIDELGLEKPLVVGWSMGGWAIFDYLRIHGDKALSGIVTIGAGVKMNAVVAATRHPDVKGIGMYHEDQAIALDAAIRFIRSCFAAPLSKRDLAFMTGYNMLVSPEVRKASRLRDEDYTNVLAGVTVPIMVVQGQQERICIKPMYEEIKQAMPKHTIYKEYNGVGHAAFWEDPERFNADLAEFAATLFQQAIEEAIQ